MSELPRLSRSLRAHSKLETQRNLGIRPEDRINLQIWRSKEQKRYLNRSVYFHFHWF